MPVERVVVRDYQSDDRAAVVALSLRAWRPVFASMRAVVGDEIDRLLHGDDWETFQSRAVEEVLDDESQRVWVAECDGRVAGFVAVILHRADSTGQIWMIAVDPDAQKRGLGKTLTDLATDWMRGAGMRVALVQTGGDEGHAAARRTYEKAGFTALPGVNYLKAL